MSFENLSLTLEKGQMEALRRLKGDGKYKSMSEMGRVAIREFLNKEIRLIEVVKMYADGLERVVIDGKTFKVITK